MTESRPALLFAMALCAGCAGVQVERITVPDGFAVDLVATGVEDARAMAFGDRGTLFVGSNKAGKVHAVRYPPAGAEPAQPVVIAQDMENPHGVAFRDGALYVAERSRILRYDGIEDRLDAPPAPTVVFDDLPRYAHHGLRTIHFGPDGALYVPIGVPCNICLPEARYGTINRLDLDASSPSLRTIARGVRNSVGYDWDPATGDLWFTDNGRDLLGDDTPPDELNHLARSGQHFGYPYCHGGELADPQFGQRRGCRGLEPPAQKLGPHVAALGMRFYTGEQFPADYRGAIFIAEHGSWNRSQKLGYRVMVVHLRDGRPASYAPFAQGWLSGNRAWGRPVDVIVAPDGALLVSDDKTGSIYRIRYVGR